MVDFLSSIVATGSTTSGAVATAISGVSLAGLLQEIIDLLPVLLPTLVGFIAVRKGISFLIGSLRRA